MTTSRSKLAAAGETSLAVISATEQRILVLVEEFKLTFRRTLELSVDLGEALEAHKATLPHGDWLPWVEEHFELGERMARRFMELYRNRSDLTDLPASTSMDAAVKWLQAQRRQPKATPLQDGEPDGEGGIDGEAPGSPLLRFAPPDTPTHVLVQQMLLTLFPDALTVLDATFGSGSFWSGSSPYRVVGHDLDPDRAPDGVMDFTDLQYNDATFDVVLLDPPHLADGGDDAVMAGRFGTVATQAALDNLIIDGTREAWRCCSKGIIVKVSDHVHGQVFQDETVLIGEALGYIDVYDKVYQVRSHAFIDPSWGEQCSAYNNGSVFLVYRKGDQRHVRRGRED
jgi:hypothetical protein